MPKIIVHVADTTGRECATPAFINGKKVVYPINTPFEASDDLLALLTDSSMTVEVLPEGGSPSAPVDDEGAAEDHGGAGGAITIEDEPEAEPEAAESITQNPQETAENGASEPAESTTPEPHPLDHDGDGKPGGSLPGPKATRTRKKAAPKA